MLASNSISWMDTLFHWMCIAANQVTCYSYSLFSRCLPIKLITFISELKLRARTLIGCSLASAKAFAGAFAKVARRGPQTITHLGAGSWERGAGSLCELLNSVLWRLVEWADFGWVGWRLLDSEPICGPYFSAWHQLLLARSLNKRRLQAI